MAAPNYAKESWPHLQACPGLSFLSSQLLEGRFSRPGIFCSKIDAQPQPGWRLGANTLYTAMEAWNNQRDFRKSRQLVPRESAPLWYDTRNVPSLPSFPLCIYRPLWNPTKVPFHMIMEQTDFAKLSLSLEEVSYQPWTLKCDWILLGLLLADKCSLQRWWLLGDELGWRKRSP